MGLILGTLAWALFLVVFIIIAIHNANKYNLSKKKLVIKIIVMILTIIIAYFLMLWAGYSLKN
ncbi:hypothetical protein DY124_05365 [Apilactobacillus micheneri]|nr:hypothetical protein DY124_05365 [Apilactobacillus micheneri]TPR47536.1 hypothetical protein DY125_05365 [Apilactobacillus micheneri]